MAGLKSTGTARKTDRLEAFSDAVLAIAITLPVVALESPHVKEGKSLTGAYAALWPGYVSYALSCLVIGLYWAHSHFSGKIVRKTDHGFNLLTVLFLAMVSITPFPARPFVEHLSDAANSRIAATVYASLLAAPSWVWFGRWYYAVRQNLLDPRLSGEYVSNLTRKYAVTAAASGVSVLLCWLVDWRLGMGVAAVVILSYLLPPMMPQYKSGQEPHSELQEAGEEGE